MVRVPPSPVSMCNVILKLTNLAIQQEKKNHAATMNRLRETKKAMLLVRAREQEIEAIRQGKRP